MASRFSCPLNIPTPPTSGRYCTLFEPNAGSGDTYYNGQVYVKDFKFSDNCYDSTGHLKSVTNLVMNNSTESGHRETGWRFGVNKSNQLTFGYIYWVAKTDKFYYTTKTSSNNSTAEHAAYKQATKYYAEYILPGMTVEQGVTYDFIAKRTGVKEVTATLTGSDGSSQTVSGRWGAFNDNYDCDVVVGATGCSFEQLKVQGYKYGSNCLYSINVTPDLWDHKSSSCPITIESSCGDSKTLAGTMGSAYTLSVYIPTSFGGARAASASGAITWKNGTYNSSTYTGTKMFVEDEEIDLPSIGAYVNKGIATASNVHTDNTNAFFMGYSEATLPNPSGTGYTPYPIVRWDTNPGIMPGNDLKLYAVIGPFDLADLTLDFVDTPLATTLTINGKATGETDSWSSIVGATLTSRYSDPGSSQWPVAATSVSTYTTTGTVYDLLNKQTAEGVYKVTSKLALHDYEKTGHSTLTIKSAKINIPTTKGPVVYNGTTQTAQFNDYPNDRINILLKYKAKDAGTYTARFTLKDPYRTTWSDGTTGAKDVDGVIEKKPLTFVSGGTTTWEFDGNKHSTVCNFTGVCSGDTCYATYSGNSIKLPGSSAVSTTGVTNANYSLATQTTTITVTKRTLSLAWSNITKEYNGSVLQPVVVATNGVSGYTVTLSCTPSSSAAIGTYTSTASLGGTSGTYYQLPTPSTQSISITKIVPIVDGGTLTWKYDGNKHSASPVITNQIGGACTLTLSNNSVGPDPDAQIVKITGVSNSNYDMPAAADLTRIIVVQEVDISYGNIYYWNGSKGILVY